MGAKWPHTHSAVWAAGRTLASGQALADLGASARFAKTAGRSVNLRRVSSASHHIGLSSLCYIIAQQTQQTRLNGTYESADDKHAQQCSPRPCQVR